MADIFNYGQHTEVNDIVISCEGKSFTVTSINPIALEPQNDSKSKSFKNLSHFMRIFENYVKMSIEMQNEPYDPWGNATIDTYREHVIDFITDISKTYPEPYDKYSVDLQHFIKFCACIDTLNPIECLEEFKKTLLYIKLMHLQPQFKKSSKKAPKSSKKAPKKAPKSSKK